MCIIINETMTCCLESKECLVLSHNNSAVECITSNETEKISGEKNIYSHVCFMCYNLTVLRLDWLWRKEGGDKRHTVGMMPLKIFSFCSIRKRHLCFELK